MDSNTNKLRTRRITSSVYSSLVNQRHADEKSNHYAYQNRLGIRR